MKFKSTFVAPILGTALLFAVSPVFATPILLDLTVTGGTSDGVMGTPGSFSGSFDIAGFTGSGAETFTGAAQIANFEVSFNNVWDAGNTASVGQIFMAPVNDGLFSISFLDGVLTAFDFVSLEFDPLDLLINFPGGANAGADWDLITDSDVLVALRGTLSVTVQSDNGGGDNEIPEPGTFSLIALGLAGLAFTRRRRFLCDCERKGSI